MSHDFELIAEKVNDISKEKIISNTVDAKIIFYLLKEERKVKEWQIKAFVALVVKYDFDLIENYKDVVMISFGSPDEFFRVTGQPAEKYNIKWDE